MSSASAVAAVSNPAAAPASDAGAPSPSPEATAGAQVEDVAAYCGRKACGSYPDELRAMQERASKRREAGACSVAAWGSCGTLHFLDESEGLSGTVRYFDDPKRLTRSICPG